MGARIDPVPVSSFYLDISGKITGLFRECAGLGSESEIITQLVAGPSGQQVLLKIPGAVKFDNIVLKRGVTNDMQIWEWRKLVEDGKVNQARMNGTITMFDQENNSIAEWTFENAWPCKVSGPTLNSGNNEIAVEELHIAHEGMKREKV
ncbi:MAG: phage tail protein [Dehalococcoidia bacterium]|nr:phage tail protein [Dehalococcoidia bacterium]